MNKRDNKRDSTRVSEFLRYMSTDKKGDSEIWIFFENLLRKILLFKKKKLIYEISFIMEHRDVILWLVKWLLENSLAHSSIRTFFLYISPCIIDHFFSAVKLVHQA